MMKPAIRRTIRIIAISLFIVLAPGIILYAMGYRYNLTTGEFGQVGILVIETKPRDVQIFVNGEKEGKRTPKRVTDLPQGDHHVLLQKDGYESWEKTVFIESRLVTWIRDVILFTTLQEDLPLLEQGINIVFTSQDPYTSDRAIIIAENESSIALYLLQDAETQNIPLTQEQQIFIQQFLSAQHSTVEWDTNRDIPILLTYSDTDAPTFTSDLMLISSDSVTSINKERLSLSTDASSNTFFIDIDTYKDPASILLLTDTHRLQRFSLTDNTVTLFAEDIKAFTFDDNTLVTLSTSGELKTTTSGLLTSEYTIPASTLKHRSVELIPHTLHTARPQLILENNTAKQFNHETTLDILSNATDWILQTEGDDIQIAFKSRNEITFINYMQHPPKSPEGQLIHILPFIPNTPETLIRLSNPIHEFSWHPKGAHIALTTEEELRIAELDGRNIRNTVQLPLTNSNNTPSLVRFNKTGEYIVTIQNDTLIKKRITE